MPGPRKIKAGGAFVELFADDSRLVRGLRKAQARLKAFGAGVRAMGTKLAAAGTLIAAPIIAAAAHFAKFGDDLAKMSRRTGVAVGTLSELAFAAQQSGATAEQVEKAFFGLSRALFDAKRGSAEAVDSLAELGLTYKALEGLKPDEQMAVIAEGLSRIADESVRGAIAQKLFGRQGRQLLPMFADGAKGIEKLRQEARDLNLTMSGDDALAAENFTDAMGRLGSVAKRTFFAIGAAVAGPLEALLGKITQNTAAISKWIDQNRGVIVSVLKVAAIIGGAGVALIALGSTIGLLGASIGKVAGVFVLLGKGIGLIAAGFGALLTPIGAVSAAVVALGGYLLTSTQAGADALRWLGDRFAELKDGALKSFKAIGQALAAGDIELAGRVLWLSLKLLWQKGVTELKLIWLDFKQAFTDTAAQAIGFFGTTWASSVAEAKRLWSDFTTSISTVFLKAFRVVGRTVIRSILPALELLNKVSGGKFSATIDNANALLQDGVLEGVVDARIKETAEANRKRQTGINKDEQDAVSAIAAQTAATRKAIEDNARRARLDTISDLDAAREAWKDSLVDAAIADDFAFEGAAFEGAAGETSRKRSKLDIEGILGDASKALQGAAEKISVTGTFNAIGLAGLSNATGKAADRTAKATEETAKELKRIRRQPASAGAVFA